MNRSAAHTALCNALLLALGSRPDLGKFWKQATGSIETPSGAYIRYGLVGSADMSGILCTGQRCELECKTGSAVQSKEQKNFEAMITEYHGVYILCRDIQVVLTTLEGVCGSRKEACLSAASSIVASRPGAPYAVDKKNEKTQGEKDAHCQKRPQE